MAQHDYTIANQTFPATRTDLNNVFAAIVSQNSGATAPSTTYAYMLWYDTTTDILKMRNANDDAWVDLFTIDQVADTATPSAAQGSNLIINGAMQVAQRGTSFTATGYSLDHWFVSNAGTCTLTQDTADVPTNFKYAAKIVTSAGSSFMSLYQPFESVDYEAFKNKTVTISFYAKVNATFSGAMFIDMQAGDTADTLLSGTWAGTDPQYITPTTSWARYTVSIAVGSTNGIRFVISPLAGQASGTEYSITGVQLKVGSTATPFEHRSYGDELARCQRYYLQQAIDIQTPIGGYMIVPIYFPTTMRAAPATSAVAAGSTAGGLVSEGIGGLHTQGAYYQVQSSANSNYRLGRIDAYSAEL